LPAGSGFATVARLDAGRQGSRTTENARNGMQIVKRPAWAGTLALALLWASGCSGSSSDDNGGGGNDKFEPESTDHAAAGGSPLWAVGQWLLYLADEGSTGPGGTNMNSGKGDLDELDQIAVAVDMKSGETRNLHTATEDAAILGNQVWLVVDEDEDTKDWDLDGMADDLVLLHWSRGTDVVQWVDTLDPVAKSIETANGRLYYCAVPAAPLMASESSVRYVQESAPRTPLPVMHAVPSAVAQGLSPAILGRDEGLLWLALDETVETIDLNDDGDATDEFVMALLDGTDPSAMLLSPELALPGANAPVRARKQGAGDWTVAFLVSEADQDDFPTGLNDPDDFHPDWVPEACDGTYDDTDRTDDVLFFLEFAAWAASPGANPPVNTGLAGANRVFVVPNFVATLTPEEDDGDCSTNGDGDTDDIVLRWTRKQSDQLLIKPFGSSDEILAIRNVPGGTRGVTDLDGRWIAVIDEADDDRDHDPKSNPPGSGDQVQTLVAWLDPADGNSATWEFNHSSGPDPLGVGGSYMAERKERDRILVGFQESVFGMSINVNGDNDILDSTPTFVSFDPGNADDLDFPGPAVALDSSNPGMVLAEGVVFYRVDETEDDRDWNNDGDLDDQVMWRTRISDNSSVYMGTLNDLAGPVIVASDFGAACLADEVQAHRDYNGDGDQADFVVRWFRID
jgi:hypothetical protein